MAKSNDQLVELVTPILAAGEELLGTVRVNYNGTVQTNALTVAQGVAGVDADAAPVDEPDPDAVIGFPSANQMALALTGGRIFVWSLGFSGKPKQFIGEVPITAISEVHAGETNFGPLLRLVMKSGAVVDLEIKKGEPADDFIDQVKHLVP